MVYALEGLRGIAALVVALFHLRLFSAQIPLVKYGYLFVDLFFVLSGFVIAAAYANRLRGGDDAATFLIRRFGRLFPLMIVANVLYVLALNAAPAIKDAGVALGLGGVFKSPGFIVYHFPAATEWLSTVTLTQGMGVHDRLAINYVSWSISAEFWTYLLFAAICVAFAVRRRWALVATLALVGLAGAVWLSVRKGCLASGSCMTLSYDYGFVRCVGSFMLGALTWRIATSLRTDPSRAQLPAAVAVLAVFLLVGNLPGLAFLLPLLFAVLVWSLSADTGWLGRALAGRAGRVLGQRSYSIYMLHPVILLLGFSGLANGTRDSIWAVPVVLLFLASCYVAAGWSYRWIEHPAREWFNQRASRLRSAPTREDRQGKRTAPGASRL